MPSRIASAHPMAPLACRAGLGNNRRNGRTAYQTGDSSRNLPDRPPPDTGLGRSDRGAVILWAAVGDATSVLGQTTLNIYLNGDAYWRNVPAAVWRYKLGGYQVLKKWLSYRERGVLGRALLPEEVLYFAEVARRIGTILAVTDTPAVSDYTAGSSDLRNVHSGESRSADSHPTCNALSKNISAGVR